MRHTVLAIFAAGLMTALLGAQPNTTAPAESLVREYVAAFNEGEAAMRSFLERSAAQNVPIDQRLARYRELKGDMRTLAIRAIVSSTADAVAADLANADGAVARFEFMLAGGKLTGIGVEMGGPGPGAPEERLAPRDEATAAADIAALVAQAAAADEFSGVVHVARGDYPTWSTAVGDADKSSHVKNTLETKFNLGSIGKAFTAIAIAQLVHAGRLSLDDTVGRFLPDYPNAVVRERVAVKHLLDMESGIGDFFGPKYEAADRTHLRTLADYLPLFAGEPLHFAPGQKREYSNGGFVVLGLIVEKVSGQPYDEYLRAHLFAPAGMRDTGFFPKSEPAAGRATGYTTRLGNGRRSNFETLPERGSSAGGVYSTAPDLLRFVKAAGSGDLVPLEALLRVGRDPRAMGVAGGAPGLNAALDTGVNGYTVIVLSNYDPPSAERLARAITRVLRSVKA
jgi:CubicO group peptidase (beta-lactamase class C family)